MINKLCAIVAMFSAVSCSKTPQAEVATLLVDAHLAQAGGAGGCTALLKVDTTTSIYFPDIRVFQGRCLLEHGDTFATTVARDESGITYLLDSPSSFRLLLRRHPPVAIDSSSVINYAMNALIYSGRLEATAQLVQDFQAIPDSVLEADGRMRDEIVPSGVQEISTGLAIVWVTARSGNSFYTFGVTVNQTTGEIVILQAPGG
ncbi:MAG: hypothetical protein ACREQV_22825 [Candidatus Binatia bacterium]